MGKYVITQSKSGKYHFNLVAGNGETILTSQMYASRSGATKGLQSVGVNAPDAPIEDQTAKEVVVQPSPKFEVFAGKDDLVYFRLIASNGKVIGSSEGYSTLKACKNGINSVKKNALSEVEKDAEKKTCKRTCCKKK